MNFEIITNNITILKQGLWMTVEISILSIILSMLLGTILGIIRYSKIKLLSYITGIFIDITRSIPLILYIIFVHFSISPMLYNPDILKYFGINCIEMFSAVLAIVIFTSAYIAEILRSGFNSIEKEQIMAAKSLALTSNQAIWLVILPQAIQRMKPALCAQFITLVKDTSLASAIGVIELTRASEIIYETSLNEFQILIFVALVYITLNSVIQMIFSKRFAFVSNLY